MHQWDVLFQVVFGCWLYFVAFNLSEHQVSINNFPKKKKQNILISLNQKKVTMSVGAGTVADCWQITERGSAFSFLFVGQFLGPLVGKKKKKIV